MHARTHRQAHTNIQSGLHPLAIVQTPQPEQYHITAGLKWSGSGYIASIRLRHVMHLRNERV